MPKSRALLQIAALCFALLVYSSLACAQAKAEVGADKSPTADITANSFSNLLKGVISFKLSNGMRVVMYRRKQAPVFFGQVWVRVGGVNETTGATGLAHFLEHMAFKGTSTIGTKDFKKENVLLEELDTIEAALKPGEILSESEAAKAVTEQLKSLWVENEFSTTYEKAGGASLNAGTANDYTFYMVKLPNVAFELWCWMESERLLHPVFRQFYEERNVVREERRSSYDDSPGGLIYEAMLASAYWSHPNRMPVIGWPADIESLSRKQMQEFYSVYYRPDNMVLSLVGDLDPDSAKPLLEKYFGRIKSVSTPLPEINVKEPAQRGERRIEIEFDADPRFVMAYHKPPYPNSDDVFFTVLHELLAGGRSAVFYKELVKEKKLATGVYSSEAPSSFYPNLYFISATPSRGVSVETLEKEIEAIFARVARDGVSDMALQAALRRLQVGLLEQMSSNYGLAKMLGEHTLMWGDWTLFVRYYSKLQKTTSSDIQRTIKKYITPKNKTFVKLVKPIEEF